jgi:RNA-splicing ligase RtcB
MKVAQRYASRNRATMGRIILGDFFGMDADTLASIESVHNYINFEDNIMRKGSISAHFLEKVIIPLNMADGIIVGTGKGNEDWNFSAPHGAGRKMSRSKAKATIQLEDFQDIMRKKGVWSSTADKHTLDEAPQAYKNASHIIKYLADTVDIKVQMKPVYNFKAAE